MAETLLMVAAIAGYSLPILVAGLMLRFESSVERLATAVRMVIFQAICTVYWSFPVVDPEAFDLVFIARGMLIPTLGMGVLGWSKLTPNSAAAFSKQREQIIAPWAIAVICWVMMTVFIVHSFTH